MVFMICSRKILVTHSRNARKINEMPSTPKPDLMADRTDMDRLRGMTDAEIEHAVSENPDTFIPDAAWIANARVASPPVKEVVDARLRGHDVGRPTG